MSRPPELEVANFVCRFGDRFVLNDLLENVVLPAFFTEARREYRDTSYFFTQRQFTYLRDNDIESLALVCRFIKKTVLRRHQIFTEDDGIVPDEQSMDSAPSSIAVLLLKTHRLLFVREVPNAPSVHQFGSTFKYFVKHAVMDYRNSAYEQRRDSGTRVFKKHLKEEFPIPDIHVVPIVSNESLREFIARFETLRTLKVRVAATNQEIDNEEFFRSLRGSRREVGSQTTAVQHHNPNGLDKNGCLTHVEAAKQGNVFVELRGVDENGDKLTGDNDKFSVRAALPPLAESVGDRAIQATDKYFALLDDEVVSVGEPERDYSQQLEASHRQFHEGVDE